MREENRNKDSLYELDLGEYSEREENRNKDSLYELDLGEYSVSEQQEQGHSV